MQAEISNIRTALQPSHLITCSFTTSHTLVTSDGVLEDNCQDGLEHP